MKSLIAATLVTCATFTHPCLAEEASRPPTPTNDAVNIPYSGTVTEVTKDSISVLWPGEKEPKKFPISATLAAGEIPKEPRLIPGRRQAYVVRDPYRYRLQDVKVGDHVVVRFAHLGNTDVCDHICILKRPGGRVPPLPEGAATPKPSLPGFEVRITPSQIPYHERMNAYWDLEEKGIPYPEKFGRYRRWPVAPMPREVRGQPATTP